METFKGYRVPRHHEPADYCDTVEQLRQVCCWAKFASICSEWGCQGVMDCSDCIFYADDATIEEFAEKKGYGMFGKKKKNNEMPVLKAGDVVHCADGRWALVINHNENGVWGYRVEDKTLDSCSRHLTQKQIEEIYRQDDSSGIFGDIELVELVNSRPEKWLIWKREPTVQELTVDEISEKLGYEVKVVGNDRC